MRFGEARWSLMGFWPSRSASSHADGRDNKQLPPKSVAFLVAFLYIGLFYR